MPNDTSSKMWYLSKTLWTNLFLGVLAIAVPAIKEHLTPEVVGGIFMVINIVLRAVTKDKLELRE